MTYLIKCCRATSKLPSTQISCAAFFFELFWPFLLLSFSSFLLFANFGGIPSDTGGIQHRVNHATACTVDVRPETRVVNDYLRTRGTEFFVQNSDLTTPHCIC